MKVTQRYIANKCRVSQATVSRVLAGDQRVESDIRDKVLAAIKRYNYKPDERGRSLRKSRTHLIGLVLKRPPHGLQDDPFFAHLVADITEFLSETPYHLCVDMVNTSARQAEIYDELLRTHRVDGIIMVEPESRDQRLARLQEDRFPFVVIGNPLGARDVWSVDNDNVYAGELATRHLLENGYSRIGILAGPEGVAFSEDRIQGYLRAIEGAQDLPMVWHSDFGNVAANETAKRLLGSNPLPDALVVLDDYMAMGVIQAARSHNLSIPEDLGLVSFNNTGLCAIHDHGLTSISLNISEIVSAACSRLLAIVEGREPEGTRRTIIPCELFPRGSSLRTQGVASR